MFSSLRTGINVKWCVIAPRFHSTLKKKKQKHWLAGLSLLSQIKKQEGPLNANPFKKHDCIYGSYDPICIGIFGCSVFCGVVCGNHCPGFMCVGSVLSQAMKNKRKSVALVQGGCIKTLLQIKENFPVIKKDKKYKHTSMGLLSLCKEKPKATIFSNFL